MAQTAVKTASSTSSAAKSATKGAAKGSAKPPAKAAAKPVSKRAAAPVKAAKPAKPPKAPKVPKAAKPKPKLDATPAAKPAVAAKAVEAKQKLVRDSFTMPRADFDVIDKLKTRALAFHRPAKKSELLRAGLHALAAQSDGDLAKSLSALTPLKAGRPKKQA